MAARGEEYSLSQRQDLVNFTRDWLQPQYGEEAWTKIVSQIKLYYRQRSASRALVSLCLFHPEKSPSFWMYPSGDFICYGCGAHGDMADFIFEDSSEPCFPGRVPPSRLLALFGVLPDELRDVDSVFEEVKPKLSIGQLALLAAQQEGEEPF